MGTIGIVPSASSVAGGGLTHTSVLCSTQEGPGGAVHRCPLASILLCRHQSSHAPWMPSSKVQLMAMAKFCLSSTALDSSLEMVPRQL